MVEQIQLLRNIGKFDSVNAGAQLPFKKLALVYAENARGKTTLAAILRSLNSGEPAYIGERHRLAAQHPPHAVVKISGIAAPMVFQNNAWNTTHPHIAIFDDLFVAQNVCSGLEVASDHRQNLHELILGAQGVTLNATLQSHIDAVEAHGRTLKAKGEAIPSAARGPYSVEAFCALTPVADIDNLIQQAERSLAAAQSAEPVKKEPLFAEFLLAPFDEIAVNNVLAKSLPDLEAEAATQVQTHIAKLGEGGEVWVSDGVTRIAGASQSEDHEACPFCDQDLRTSPLISHYRAYFSDAYAELKQAITTEITVTIAAHGGDIPAAFERAVRLLDQRREFWGRFTALPELNIDTAEVSRLWKAAREGVLEALRTKERAPLDAMSLSVEVLAAIQAYNAARDVVNTVFAEHKALNVQIALVKEQAAEANAATLAADLAKLKAQKARFEQPVADLCQAYIDEKTAKTAAEALRDAARVALDQYRQNVFPAYQAAINAYLQRFNASFRLDSVTSQNSRAGSSCSYNVVINNVPVALNGGNNVGPSFKNTLSAGDRNTLALAFFFASLENDPALAQKIVVIDDPMTSLDDHRSLATVHEMRRLLPRVSQIIVFSHEKKFLCDLWKGADRTNTSSTRLIRDGEGSTFETWNVNDDCISEHDKRHEKLVAYIRTGNAADARPVAESLRLIIENFVRVAYPGDFKPGAQLGPFIGECDRVKNTANQILSANDLTELRELLDFAHRYHHETNQAYQTEAINDQELVGFCQRTLAFTRRP